MVPSFSILLEKPNFATEPLKSTIYTVDLSRIETFGFQRELYSTN